MKNNIRNKIFDQVEHKFSGWALGQVRDQVYNRVYHVCWQVMEQVWWEIFIENHEK